MEEEEKKNQEKTGGWGLTILALVLLGAAIFFFTSRFPFWTELLTLIGTVAALIFAVWLEWAPKDFIVGFNQEGDFRIVVRGGAYWKTLLRWWGWHLASQKEVVQGMARRKGDIILDSPQTPPAKSLRRLLGGFVFLGIPPFQLVMSYPFRWKHYRGDKVVFHDEVLDYGYAKWDVYAIEIRKMEDKDGLALDLVLLMPMRIVNPYEALFVVGNWLAMITAMLLPPIKIFVGSHSYLELVPMKATEEEGQVDEKLEALFWAEIEEALEDKVDREGTFVSHDEKQIRIYGVIIDKLRAGFQEIDPPESYRHLTTLRYQAEQEAIQTKIAGEAAGQATAQRVTIAVTAIARQLAGYQADQELSPDQWKKVGEMTDQAYQYWLTSQGLESIKSSDKIIITGGGQQVGADVAGLTIREAVRQEIGKKIEKEKKEGEKEE